MKKWWLWLTLLACLPFIAVMFAFVSGGMAFTPLSSLFGSRWRYNGGMGFGRLAPLPNQSAIIYSSSQTGTSHIYSVSWGGTASRQLTTDPGGDSDAAVSPNGKTIIFVRQSGDSTHLWAMNINGTGQHQITFGPDSQTQPCFAPNSKQIAYVNSPHYGLWRIWLANANGTRAGHLTNSPLNDQDTCPVFDKTGTTVFYSYLNGTGVNTALSLQIHSVSTRGVASAAVGSGTAAAVSPNGTQIAFYDAPQNQTLGIMNTNGTGRRVVGTNLGDGLNLAFCANGSLLTFKASAQAGKVDFVTINSSTGAAQTVATVSSGS